MMWLPGSLPVCSFGQVLKYGASEGTPRQVRENFIKEVSRDATVK